MVVDVTSLALWNDKQPLCEYFDKDFQPGKSILNTGSEVSSPFLPSLRAVDDARRAVVELVAAMDRTRGRGSQVKCVCFQDAEQTRAVVVHIVAVRRDASSMPVIQVRYRLVADGPAVTLGKMAKDVGTILVNMKAGGTLCLVELSPRAQLILLGVLDGNRFSGKYSLPLHNAFGDMEPSYITCMQQEPDSTVLKSAATAPACAACKRYGRTCNNCTMSIPEKMKGNKNKPVWRWRSKPLHFWRKRRAQFRQKS